MIAQQGRDPVTGLAHDVELLVIFDPGAGQTATLGADRAADSFQYPSLVFYSGLVHRRIPQRIHYDTFAIFFISDVDPFRAIRVVGSCRQTCFIVFIG